MSWLEITIFFFFWSPENAAGNYPAPCRNAGLPAYTHTHAKHNPSVSSTDWTNLKADNKGPCVSGKGKKESLTRLKNIIALSPHFLSLPSSHIHFHFQFVFHFVHIPSCLSFSPAFSPLAHFLLLLLPSHLAHTSFSPNTQQPLSPFPPKKIGGWAWRRIACVCVFECLSCKLRANSCYNPSVSLLNADLKCGRRVTLSSPSYPVINRGLTDFTSGLNTRQG